MVKNNLLQSVLVGKGDVKINLLEYVNDTLFLCKTTTENIFVIKIILRYFELVSGLKINYLKSIISGKYVDVGAINIFATILNYDVMSTSLLIWACLLGKPHVYLFLGWGCGEN